MKIAKDQIEKFILKEIPQNPRGIVAHAMKAFSTSRVTVLRYLNRLIKEGEIIRTGENKGVYYSLAKALDKELVLAIESGLEEHAIWERYFKKTFRELPENIYQICNYGFTEMVNNAIDHSEGNKIKIITKRNKQLLTIIIVDDGVGIFKKIKEAFQLTDERESILRLSQGKVTTDPKSHSGEGVFFTSRAFDQFALMANGYYYRRKNLENDWVYESRQDRLESGTVVSMEISMDSKRLLTEVFKPYTHPETKTFDRTNLVVEFTRAEEQSMISRSQARRLLAGADRFRKITLDFSNVKNVGQGFVDEVFRVFKNNHPGIQIDYVHANDDVRFMIERGLAGAPLPSEGEPK